MSTKEHCHGCGKLWSEESPDCLFNYHKKLDHKCDFSISDHCIECSYKQSLQFILEGKA